MELLKQKVILRLTKALKMCSSPSTERGSDAGGHNVLPILPTPPGLAPLGSSQCPPSDRVLLSILKPDSLPASPTAEEGTDVIYQYRLRFPKNLSAIKYQILKVPLAQFNLSLKSLHSVYYNWAHQCLPKQHLYEDHQEKMKNVTDSEGKPRPTELNTLRMGSRDSVF